MSCQEKSGTARSEYIPIAPEYGRVGIVVLQDTISFPLTEHTYNRVKPFNLFTEKGITYIAFYDKRSVSINIFEYKTRKNITVIPILGLFPSKDLRKVSAYVSCFDSIFIATVNKLTLIDSTRKAYRSIGFLRNPKLSLAEIATDAPPVVRDGHFYTAVGSYADGNSPSSVRKWRLVYDFDLGANSASLLYHYPERYSDRLYGSVFLDQSYCINDSGRFVFSFMADSCIYETNFAQHHKAYLAKSRHQNGDIEGFSEAELKDPKRKLKNVLIRDTYSSIYFDAHRKRYLRVMRSGISEAAFDARVRTKPTRLIILDEKFRIIGESDVPSGISTSALFFSPDGEIYARVNERDEHAIHFVRLSYSDEKEPEMLLGQLKTK